MKPVLFATFWSLAIGFIAACVWDKPRESAALPEPPYHGPRTDIDPAEFGSAAFLEPRFSPDGKFLVTFSIRNLDKPLATVWESRTGKTRWMVQVWDAANGKLLSTFDAAHAEIIDGKGRRVIAGPLKPNVGGTGVFAADNGKELTWFTSGHGRPFTLTDDGSALVFIGQDSIQVWSIEPQALIRSGLNPLPPKLPLLGRPNWVASPDGRWLALGILPSLPPGARARYFLTDLRTVQSRELTVPDGTGERSTYSFAFSRDGEHLAIGTGRGIWIYQTAHGTWGPFIAGDSQGPFFLTPIGFSAGGRRLVAHGRQQVFVFDVTSGRTVGSTLVDPKVWLKISDDGSRIVAYSRDKDWLRVLDGRDAHQIGWLCAYSCNAPLKIGYVSFAISPDGKSLAASHPHGGSGIFSVDQDRLMFPLEDPAFPRPIVARAAPLPTPHDSAAANLPPTSSESAVSAFGERLKSAVSPFSSPPDTVDSFPDAAVNRRFRMRREGIVKMKQVLLSLVVAESTFKADSGAFIPDLPAKYMNWDSLNRSGIRLQSISFTPQGAPGWEDPGGWVATLAYNYSDFVCTIYVGEPMLVFPGTREREPFCHPGNTAGLTNQPQPYQRPLVFRVNPPPNPLNWDFGDRCQGKKCEFDFLLACTDIPTRSEPNPDSPPSFTWNKGEVVRRYETRDQLVSPGMVIFRGAITVPVVGKDPPIHFTPADTVYPMSTAGDGTYDWYYRRTHRRTPPFWSANGPARLIKSEQTSWSISIVRADGRQTGWITPTHGMFVGWEMHEEHPPECKS